MKIKFTVSRTLPAIVTLLIASQQAAAGTSVGTITHSPLGNGVPMLGGAGLIILSTLLGLVSLRFLRERGRKGSFLVVCAMTGAIASAGGGVKLINEARALEAGLELIISSGGTLNIPFPGFSRVTNVTSGTQEIVDISLEPGCSLEEIRGKSIGNGGGMMNGGNGGTFRGTCDDKPSTVLNSGDFCDILVCCENGGGQGGNGGCVDPD